jgi:catechol 2,3-dioxygenase-like lactoylglutathione lyase family enzyme
MDEHRTPPLAGIDHVQLAAPPGCEADARRFYGDLLGLVEIPKPPELAARGGVWFWCGAQQLHIGVEADFRPARRAHPGLRVKDRGALEALRRRLVEHGVKVDEPPGEVPGVTRFFAFDPFGNRLELLAAHAGAT